MKCNNCGAELDNNILCTNCGTPLVQQQRNNDTNSIQNFYPTPKNANNFDLKGEETKAKLLSITSIMFLILPILYHIITIFFYRVIHPELLTIIITSLPIVGFYLMIYIRTNYSEYSFTKIIVYVYLVCFILAIIGLIIFIITCAHELSECGERLG